MLFRNAVQRVIQIALRKPLCHTKILIQIVAAVSCRGARNITLKVIQTFL